jgi:hypothetical protein
MRIEEYDDGYDSKESFEAAGADQPEEEMDFTNPILTLPGESVIANVEAARETHEYAFDVKLFAAIRVKAKSEAEARAMMRECISAATANLGAWPNGDPIVCEVSCDDTDHDTLYEIDGEDV